MRVPGAQGVRWARRAGSGFRALAAYPERRRNLQHAGPRATRTWAVASPSFDG
jgi:hypothetical protein